jgi:hypothetical protein
MPVNTGTASLEKLLDDGWAYHDKESERLARELEAVADPGIPPSLLVPFVHLSNHTIGGHLNDWPRALALGRRVVEGKTPLAETARAWGRLSVAALLAGDGLQAAELELSYLDAAGEDLAAALLEARFILVDALVASSRAGDAACLYRGAIGLAGRIAETEQSSAQLLRSIAAASNNLGWELLEMAVRNADEDDLMQLAADMSLKFWRRCGNWINEERALYLTARTANIAGKPELGLALADEALTVIAANGARPLDAALLQLARATSFAALGDDDRAGRAIVEADAAAARLPTAELKAQFVAERAKTILAAPAAPR